MVEMKQDKKLFRLVDKRAKEIFKRFAKYYAGDSKSFINKISRDYEKSGKFPRHVLETIRKIDKVKYDSAVCVIRGGIPYAVLFEALGWKVHYVLCGRKNEQHGKIRFSKGVDRTINQIRGKKVLFIENNSPRGRTPSKAVDELRKSLKIKKPDLFLDYFIKGYPKKPIWLEKGFWENKKYLDKYSKIFVAVECNGKINHRAIVEEFLEGLS
jgi:hypothetical protein